jgi:methionyl-tRNA formyltransferase
MGANQTGRMCLSELVECGANVVAVFTAPAQISISYSKKPVSLVTHCSFEDVVRPHDIPLVVVEQGMKHYCETLADFRPDVVLVSGWYHMIPRSMLKIPRLGVVGCHPSLLPKYRGGAPVTWSIIYGERETGVTMFYFDDGVDSGDILDQRTVPIGDDDTVATVYQRINEATVDMVRETIPRIGQSSLVPRKQDESQATYFPQRSPDDGLIDWSWNSRTIHNWIRAQTRPYPGAFTYVNGEKLTVLQSRLLDRPNNPVFAMAGYVVRIHSGAGAEVLTGDGSCLVTQVSWRGEVCRADEVLGRVGLKLSQRPDAIESATRGN